jgi:hypothetical protein
MSTRAKSNRFRTDHKEFVKVILKDKVELAIAELQEMADSVCGRIEKCEDELRDTIVRCGENSAHLLDCERVSIIYNYWSEMVVKKTEILDAIRDISSHMYDGDHPTTSGRCFDLLGYYVRLNHILSLTNTRAIAKYEEKKE